MTMNNKHWTNMFAIQEEYELPALPKQTSRNTTKAGRPLKPFEAKVIRLKENGKTDKNVMDTIYGCKGGCFGCYADGSQYTLTNAIKFDKPTAQILIPTLLQKDTIAHLKRCVNGDIAKRWVRNGVMGDPSYDWELATRAAETVAMAGSRMVIITKFWKIPSDDILERLALSGAIFHWSVIAGYDWTEDFDPNSRVKDIRAVMRKYKKMNDQECFFMRLCTFLWDDKQTLEEGFGQVLYEAQERFYELSEKEGIRIIETPWRFRRTDPRYDYMKKEALTYPKSYIARKIGRTNEDGSAILTKTKLWGGPIYFNDKYATIEREAHVIGCVTDCGSCPNQCGTASNARDNAILLSSILG
jgi:hypothetical protein